MISVAVCKEKLLYVRTEIFPFMHTCSERIKYVYAYARVLESLRTIRNVSSMVFVKVYPVSCTFSI